MNFSKKSEKQFKTLKVSDFLGSPVAKTSPFNTGFMDSIPDQGAQDALQPKSQNIKQEQYCNKFNKTLKMVHIKKIYKKKGGGVLKRQLNNLSNHIKAIQVIC